jgi:molybdate-binding protein/DNA-binding XRE family transcriptional regulator
MSAPPLKLNRVKQHRLAQSRSQADLAMAAGISRTGLSAIESQRLVPSVAAALALARALQTSVEDLFDELPQSEAVWASVPTRFPCRFWAAEVAGRIVYYPLEATTGLAVRPDGATKEVSVPSLARESARRTLVVATCDPAASYLALEYSRQTPFRMVVLRRSSRQALELIEKGLAHVAGIHLAESRSAAGNQGALQEMGLRQDVQLLAVAKWEEGVAHAAAVKLRSVKQAASSKLRWVGRQAGAGARRCQDEVLGGRRLPRHLASDHTDVVALIRSGFVDAGVCVRLVAEEAQTGFLSVCEDDYDLCIPQSHASDPRITALVEVVRSPSYREALAELPGYRLRKPDLAAISSRP